MADNTQYHQLIDVFCKHSNPQEIFELLSHNCEIDSEGEGLETIEVTVNLNQDGFVGVMYAVSDDLGPKSNHYVQTKVDEIEWQKFLRGEKKSLVFKVCPDVLKKPLE